MMNTYNLDNIEIINSYIREGLAVVIDTKINKDDNFQIYSSSSITQTYTKKNIRQNEFGYYPMEDYI